ncbi:hypothetical protein DWUX_2487 [Desulfovibrio diazotrophicus]|nr:hypothetical protein DWUX_2487 [Desulfovibrio diazotrophicus]
MERVLSGHDADFAGIVGTDRGGGVERPRRRACRKPTTAPHED